jgi:C4-dicarboxylate-binding protein DctP
MEALQLGSVQMLAPSVSKFGPLGRARIRDLRPAVHLRQLRRAAQGHRWPVGKALFKKLESKGIVGLAYWDNGFKDMSANKALRSPRTSRA